MSSTSDFKNNVDLEFFGKVNASISHELKNILAIISETAGLLQDLTEMAARGEKLDLAMINTCSQDIIDEIQRGFSTIKHMNRFSHSMDVPLESVNLVSVLDLMIHLAGFLSFASRVKFDEAQQADCMLMTCPFRLQNLIYQALVFAFKSAGTDGEIQIAVHRNTNGSVRVAFTGLGTQSDLPFPAPQTKQIAHSIGAEVILADDSRAIDILVSPLIENSK